MKELDTSTANKVAVIGGGAAGFFSAINCKESHPQNEVVIFEKSDKILSKVKVSGGGRCNVTNHTIEIRKLITNYPRGSKTLKKLFPHFNTKDTLQWFESRGVSLKSEKDGRIFPVSNSSASIIKCFVEKCEKLGITIKTSCAIKKVTPTQEGVLLERENETLHYDAVIITTGGGPKLSSYDWLSDLELELIPPVPSLFTFNLPSEKTAELMGLVAPATQVKIQGTKFTSEGPILFTHWGFSGPAILKLSAFAARSLSEQDYQFKILINWLNAPTEDAVRHSLMDFFQQHRKKKISNANPFETINSRLWHYLLDRAAIPGDTNVGEISKKQINKLVNTLFVDLYEVQGKTTFKEEFVTCGGIALNNLNLPQMSLKSNPRIYFAGEILDIDGITGGFNFQAAWTTGFLAAQLQSSS